MQRRIQIIIPARFDSSRFHGKPLALIAGKEMLAHVYENCVKAIQINDEHPDGLGYSINVSIRH